MMTKEKMEDIWSELYEELCSEVDEYVWRRTSGHEHRDSFDPDYTYDDRGVYLKVNKDDGGEDFCVCCNDRRLSIYINQQLNKPHNTWSDWINTCIEAWYEHESRSMMHLEEEERLSAATEFIPHY